MCGKKTEACVTKDPISNEYGKSTDNLEFQGFYDLARQLQPDMGHSHRDVLVLHRLQFANDLQWLQVSSSAMVCDSTRGRCCDSYHDRGDPC